MKKSWFLRLKAESGSISAETAISIGFLFFTGLALISALSFAMQYQRLQTLAQESSRIAASLESPQLLEVQVNDFVHEVNPNIEIVINWQTDYVTVTLFENTNGLLNFLKNKIEASASSPQWSG